MKCCYTQAAPPGAHGHLGLPGIGDRVVGLHCGQIRGPIVAVREKKGKRVKSWEAWTAGEAVGWSYTSGADPEPRSAPALFGGCRKHPRGSRALLTRPRRTACSQWQRLPLWPCESTWRPPCATGPSACRRPRSPRGWRTGSPHLRAGWQTEQTTVQRPREGVCTYVVSAWREPAGD